ncbi:MAG: hypothetical protein L0G99_16890 [Propionibacteriales bacterium]|nr:hypothetical protein [Propionibacteriales bacterium]
MAQGIDQHLRLLLVVTLGDLGEESVLEAPAYNVSEVLRMLVRQDLRGQLVLFAEVVVLDEVGRRIANIVIGRLLADPVQNIADRLPFHSECHQPRPHLIGKLTILGVPPFVEHTFEGLIAPLKECGSCGVDLNDGVAMHDGEKGVRGPWIRFLEQMSD